MLNTHDSLYHMCDCHFDSFSKFNSVNVFNSLSQTNNLFRIYDWSFFEALFIALGKENEMSVYGVTGHKSAHVTNKTIFQITIKILLFKNAFVRLKFRLCCVLDSVFSETICKFEIKRNRNRTYHKYPSSIELIERFHLIRVYFICNLEIRSHVSYHLLIISHIKRDLKQCFLQWSIYWRQFYANLPHLSR